MPILAPLHALLAYMHALLAPMHAYARPYACQYSPFFMPEHASLHAPDYCIWVHDYQSLM